MSKEVEQRVVEMRFDNKQFESNVSTTMSTLDKLKQKLNFTGAGKSLENIGDAAKKVNMSGLAKGVEAVQMKFSSLQVVGVTALANITNSAVNAGKRIVSALTIDPIKTGFQEYETQINAVQTILANTQSKGSTLSDVNKALNELNTYADQTIYNFTEMTRNIGTFTAAGVDLDKSVTSIKGIANLAAVSGSNAQQASTAMYQLSQALAAGRVSLMDWNSVVNAGMGGEVFQTALKRTATQMGHDVDGLIEKYGSFRESLTKGQWLTADVLTETLTQLSGAYTEADLIAQGYTEKQAKDIVDLANTAVSAATDVKTFTQLWDTLKESAQSGWTQTWEILVGDFEEAKSLLSELSKTFGDIIGQSADARNALLYDSMTSNWKKITDGITEAGLSAEDFKDKISEIGKKEVKDFDKIVEDAGSLEDAFKSGALSSDLLDKALTKMTGSSEEISKKLTDLRGKYKTNEDVLKALNKAGYENADIQELIAKNTKGQTIALSDLSDAQLMSIGYTADQVKKIRELSDYAELAGGSLKTFINNVAVPQGRELLVDTLRVSLRSLIAVFERVGAAWRDVFPPTTSNQLLDVIKSIRDFTLAMRPSEETLDKLQRTFRGLFSILGIGKQLLSAILSPIGTVIGHFANLSGSILDTTASFGDWLYSLNESIRAGNSFSVISDGVTAAVDVIFNSIESVISGLGGFSGILSGIGNGISTVFTAVKDTVSDALGWIRDNITAGDIFAGLAGGGVFVLFKKFGGLLDKIKGIFDGFGDGDSLGGFSEILGSVHDSLESFQSGIKVASLVGIATAVTLLTSSLRKIAELDAGEVAFSLIAIRLMIASLTSGFKSLTKTMTKFNSKGVIKSSIALIGIATAINILASAMKKMSGLSWGDIAKGLITIGVSIAAMSAAMKVIGKSGATLRTSIALIAIAQACKMLAEALQGFSGLSWGEIARGLTAMGGALTELTLVLAVMSKVGGGKSLIGAASLLIAVQALDEISENLKKLGSLSWEEIGKGLTAMGGALLEFTAVLAVLGKVGGFGAILGGTALLIAVQSLDEISENLKRLGDMAWDEISRGLTAMGGALTELSVISGLLGKLTGFSGLIGAGTIVLGAQSLEKIADALVKFGDMAWDEIGRGLTAMGGALTELGVVSGLLGKLGGFSGLIGAGSILLAVQGLGDIADALQKFGSMAWDEIGRGLVAMGGAMAEIAVINGLTGTFAGFAGLVGAGTILLTVQGLDQLANAFQKFGSMSWDEIGRGLSAMGGALGEAALGGIVNTFSGFGAAAIAEMAEPLGNLADSVMKWQGVTVPEGLGAQIGSLADGIGAFTFGGAGAKALATFAEPIGNLADSIKKWTNVIVPEGLSGQLASLAVGIDAFTFGGFGASGLAASVAPIGDMAGAIKKWQDVTIPPNLEEGLTGIANGIEAFSFAFLGGWSISAIVQPLADLAGTVSKWNGVTIPANIGTGLQNLADGVGAFNFSFFGGWNIDGVVEPLANLADSVKKWNGLSLYGVGNGLTELANGLNSLGEVGIKKLASQFEDAHEKVSNSVTAMLNSITTAVSSKRGAIIASFDDLVASILKTITSKQTDIATAAGLLMVKFTDAIKLKSIAVNNAFSTMLSKSIAEIRKKNADFSSAGSYLVDGLAKGIKDNTWKAEAQARALASAVDKATRNVLEIHSPSKVSNETGGYYVEGFAQGISDNLSTAEDAGASLGAGATGGLEEYLEINPMSAIGAEMDEDLATGITASTAAEEAAEQKVKEIADAYEKQLDALELDNTTADLEYQLWSKNEGQTATEAEQLAKEADNLSKQLQTQTERVNIADAEYKDTMAAFGETAEETQEAYNKLLQEKIEMSELSAQLSEIQQKEFEKNKESVDAYIAWMKESASDLLKLGFTSEQINAAAAESTGGGGFIHLDYDKNPGGGWTDKEMAEGFIPNDEEIKKQGGWTSAEMEEGFIKIEKTAEKAANNIGKAISEGISNGIKSTTSSVKSAATTMANTAVTAAKSALKVNSPSKEFYSIGAFSGEGFVNALLDYQKKSYDASASMAAYATDGLSEAIARVKDRLTNAVDAQPVIRPVLDLTNVESGTSKLNAMFSRTQATTISSHMAAKVEADNQNGAPVSATKGASYQFVQNNYSPKALSRVEIYRQTRNQFSTFERMAKT